MMYEVLYRYLIRYKKLDLPGIGALDLRVEPAEAEFVNHSFLPPKYSFQFERAEDVPPERFFSWLAGNLDVSEQEAVIRFNEFLFDLNRQLKEGRQIHWPGVGRLHKEISGEIQFGPEQRELPWYREVVAKKVTRENAEHKVLVGEREKTSTEMIELLRPAEQSKTGHWWIWPLAIILAIFIFLGWYFSEKTGANLTGNNHKISPAEAPSGYKLSP